MNLIPIQTTPSVQPKNLAPPADKASHKTHPSAQTKCLPNLVLDKDYAWKTFKGLITDKNVSACYDMSIRDFEHSTIHNLFKVCSFLLSLFYFLRKFGKFLTLLHPSIFQAMAKFYTASSHAKELCDEAQATKAKSKKLNNEVLLKKREVIRLTEEHTHLQGIKKQLRK